MTMSPQKNVQDVGLKLGGRGVQLAHSLPSYQPAIMCGIKLLQKTKKSGLLLPFSPLSIHSVICCRCLFKFSLYYQPQVLTYLFFCCIP